MSKQAKNLTVGQIQALADEIEERIYQISLIGQPEFTKSVERDWEKMKKDWEDYQAKDNELDQLQARVNELEDERDEAMKKFRKSREAFEKKHDMDVKEDYSDDYDDNLEQILVPYRRANRNTGEMIKRAITLLSIDYDGPMTSDEIISRIINKRMQI